MALGDSPGPFGRGRAVDRPPAAYGRRRPKQSKPGERDGDRGFSTISENPGTFQ